MMNRHEQLYNTWGDKLTDIPVYADELDRIRSNPAEIEERFGKSLTFGTGGLRGVMGLGTNRINIFTIGQATQGLANYLSERKTGAKVAIAYDSRIDSDAFAKEAACVLTANGISVYLYQELMPTPALSFAVREFGCDAGIVITASHNHAKFNGYKVYGDDGSQIKPDVAQAVTEQISAVDIFADVQHMDYNKAVSIGLINLIPDSFVEKYTHRVFCELIDTEACVKAHLKVVYTPLHGAGNRCVREVLDEAGVAFLTVVPEQEQPDGDFPTCPEPNPENKEALELGLALCRSIGADLLIATDPDADRAAVAVRYNNDYCVLSGNEVGVLLLDYICKARKKAGTMPERPVAVKSIVSTKMADLVAQAHGVEMRTVPTGFKYVGEVIHELEKAEETDRFIFGFEESCGYLTGGYVRDKDAVNASLLIAEMTSAYRLQGKTLLDVLNELYSTIGVVHNYNESVKFDGVNVESRIQTIMEQLRLSSPQEIGKSKVVCMTDYLAGVRNDSERNKAPILFPAIDMLEFSVDNGCSIIIRPSGTESKLKIYYSIPGIADSEIATLTGDDLPATDMERTDWVHRYYHEFIQKMIHQMDIAK